MQISVFLTPIFSDQVSVGHGVCVRLADVVAAAALAHAPHDYPNDQSHGDAEHAMHLLHASATRTDLADDPHADHSQHNTHENHQKQLITQDHLTPPSTAPPNTAPPNTAPPNTTDSTPPPAHHAMDTTQCGFCLLIGHSVLPPVSDAQLASIAFFDLVQAVLVGSNPSALTSLRGWIPQSRAPPVLV